MLEGLEAASALLDVAIHCNEPGGGADSGLVGDLQQSLDELIARIRENARFSLPSAMPEPLATALEAEIKRWESRSQTDPDARPVLRAFLGLRELLWEIGVGRDASSTPESTGNDAPRPDGPPGPVRARVQRFDIDD